MTLISNVLHFVAVSKPTGHLGCTNIYILYAYTKDMYSPQYEINIVLTDVIQLNL